MSCRTCAAVEIVSRSRCIPGGALAHFLGRILGFQLVQTSDCFSCHAEKIFHSFFYFYEFWARLNANQCQPTSLTKHGVKHLRLGRNEFAEFNYIFTG